MTLEVLPMDFTVCQLPEGAKADLSAPFTFFARTDAELSLVCPAARVPENALKTQPGWRCLRVKGPLDFSLVGVLAGIAQCLAAQGIPLFAVSTFDTDYILVGAACLPRAVAALRQAGYVL